MAAQTKRQGLLEALEAVPDPRSGHGRRYRLVQVLAMSVCAMACGARSIYAIAQWGRLHRKLACKKLGITRLTTPSHPQLHRIFSRLDVKAFEAVLGEWLAQRGVKPKEAIAIDGKSLRGIHGEAVPGVHLVCAFTHQSGIVLDEEPASGKGGAEIAAAEAILERLDLEGRVVTGDAEFAQRKLCTQVGQKRGTMLSD